MIIIILGNWTEREYRFLIISNNDNNDNNNNKR